MTARELIRPIRLSAWEFAVVKNMGETLVDLVFFTASLGPFVAAGWLISMFLGRVSLREILAFMAFFGVVVAAWIKLGEIVASI
ncbi:MAG: hypothetical protein KY475_04645 [Planctomycetes bacterium]|nr:hypothetical protein [Planctomycetota bacterium]